MPNVFATLVLLSWPVVTIGLFQRLPVGRAVIASLIAAYLLLPEPPAGFDPPLIPPLTKHTIPAFVVFALCLLRDGSLRDFLPRSPVANALLLVFVFSPLVTAALNGEEVNWGGHTLPALKLRDGVSEVIGQALLIMPFLVARRYLRHPEDQRDLLLAFFIGGLIYSLPMLLEIRLSPQLNKWTYGYYQHSFAQTIRFGGFRPMVFLYHGLWAAFFMMVSAVSAFALWRVSEGKSKVRFMLAGLYLTVVLFLAKSLGSLLFAIVVIPAIVLLTRRAQLLMAVAIGLVALTYPAMKGLDLVPQQYLLENAAKIDPDRAQSLEFRFNNENQLLQRAEEKPWFGWGGWDRNQVLDPESGEVLTVTDGRWVILIGQRGWLGFIAEFGLLVLPILLLWWESLRQTGARLSPYIAPLALLLAINVLDMIPNATLTPLTWLIGGTLTGYAETLRRSRRAGAASETLSWRPAI